MMNIIKEALSKLTGGTVFSTLLVIFGFVIIAAQATDTYVVALTILVGATYLSLVVELLLNKVASDRTQRVIVQAIDVLESMAYTLDAPQRMADRGDDLRDSLVGRVIECNNVVIATLEDALTSLEDPK